MEAWDGIYRAAEFKAVMACGKKLIFSLSGGWYRVYEHFGSISCEWILLLSIFLYVTVFYPDTLRYRINCFDSDVVGVLNACLLCPDFQKAGISKQSSIDIFHT